MFESTFLDRVARLTDIRIEERRRQFPLELTAIAHRLSSKGMLRSSVYVQESKRAHERELEIRAILVWETIVRVHRTFGTKYTPELRSNLKQLIAGQVGEEFANLSSTFSEILLQTGIRITEDLSAAKSRVIAKHDVEIDLYVDSLQANQETEVPAHPVAPVYNFYGNIGAVQTGAHSTANTVQNLGAEDLAALRSALGQVKEAIAMATSLHDKYRSELLDIATEAQEQLASATPNSTKLLSVFNILATAIKGVASAQPAYVAIKAAVLPLGITLP